MIDRYGVWFRTTNSLNLPRRFQIRFIQIHNLILIRVNPIAENLQIQSESIVSSCVTWAWSLWQWCDPKTCLPTPNQSCDLINPKSTRSKRKSHPHRCPNWIHHRSGWLINRNQFRVESSVLPSFTGTNLWITNQSSTRISLRSISSDKTN